MSEARARQAVNWTVSCNVSGSCAPGSDPGPAGVLGMILLAAAMVAMVGFARPGCR